MIQSCVVTPSVRNVGRSDGISTATIWTASERPHASKRGLLSNGRALAIESVGEPQ